MSRKNTFPVQEEGYVELGGMQQYVRIRGENQENPAVIYLHGGPGYPNNYVSYLWQGPNRDIFTFIDWDQRGCGRTWYRNKKTDHENRSLTYEQSLQDLDALVTYVQNRLHKEKVILLGHSYGTLPSISYARRHPEKVTAMIGVSVVVNMPSSEEYSYQDARSRAEKAGASTKEMDEAFARFAAWKGSYAPHALIDMQNLRKTTGTYHKAPRAMSQGESMKSMFHSPDLKWADIRWLLQPFFGYDPYLNMNWPLYERLLGANLLEEPVNFSVPFYMIAGDADWITPLVYMQRYLDVIAAPDKALYTMKGCGHSCLLDDPAAFAGIMHRIRDKIGTV